MPFTIHKQTYAARLIRIGHAPEILPELSEAKPTRSMKMLEKEDIKPRVIRQDDAKEQGAIGSHGENAPAQEKVPAGPSNKPDKGERDDG